MKKMLFMLGVVVMSVMVLVGCEEDYTDMLDYENAEEFEDAINNGDGVEGSYVMVEVIEYAPNSKLGYNIQTGEHLNFVDAENPNVKVGDFVVFKVEKVANLFGSYVMTYEEHRVIDK